MIMYLTMLTMFLLFTVFNTSRCLYYVELPTNFRFWVFDFILYCVSCSR